MIHAGMNGAYERELRVAVELAREAGAAALEYYGKPLRVEHKAQFDEPVTQADRALNELIVKRLGEIFPADGILAEESVDTDRRLGCTRAWMVDPLDGTKGFIAGTDDFAVQIGLADRGECVLGVLCALPGRARPRRVGRAARRSCRPDINCAATSARLRPD